MVEKNNQADNSIRERERERAKSQSQKEFSTKKPLAGLTPIVISNNHVV